MSDEDGILDLDDPSLSEAQTYDPEADTDAYIPPPELDLEGNAIDYQLKLSLGENKLGTRQTYFKKSKAGKPFGILMVDLAIVQPGGAFDNARINSEWLMTLVQQRTGGSTLGNVCRLLGSPMPLNLNPKEMGEFGEGLIASEPILPARIQWIARCRSCEKDIGKLTGERNWPEKVNAEGQVVGHLAESTCPDCGSEVRANVEVKRFYSAV